MSKELIPGTPCTFNYEDTIMYGRYIGPSSFDDVDTVVVVATPHNSIMHRPISQINTDLSVDDLKELIDYERDAIDAGEWYHQNRTEEFIKEAGTLMKASDIVALDENSLT